MENKPPREMLDEIGSLSSDDYLSLFAEKPEGVPFFPLYPKDIKAAYLYLALKIWQAEGEPDPWTFTIEGEVFAYAKDPDGSHKLVMLDEKKLEKNTMPVLGEGPSPIIPDIIKGIFEMMCGGGSG